MGLGWVGVHMRRALAWESFALSRNEQPWEQQSLQNQRPRYQSTKNTENKDIPGGPVVEHPPANAGETDLIPGPGRFHMAQGN